MTQWLSYNWYEYEYDQMYNKHACDWNVNSQGCGVLLVKLDLHNIVTKVSPLIRKIIFLHI